MPAVAEKLLYTYDEAAALLGVCKRSIYRLIERRKLRFVRAGSRRFISRAEIDAFIARGGG